ncbi:RNA polymerase factor sigma-54 [Enterococcus dispar]|jgi:RNA polymerase sigma-54 factor|uniref:RNA polymerase sigma-54 factor n=1 Tax=Enterococcus dispar ATCC 51266 TaxID=1139219 RepID=S0KGV7_9ENTE|nr:RNA polymerase factor sigma-54 [Enterococcus dispar]EOT44074.1 RNA polymerase sigma-54 factor [Enterococcus dispar ATCC 51266]EOW85669.1 RNA polymerase sigma-54 factor [Enterococcus dispar ATCC 51266]MDT2705611.1 RNA polymerase factor sigma-54 [Enterococcus dispar]OJG38843.1 RNA polymerase sigma-54 factor [Enterococcus dispar]
MKFQQSFSQKQKQSQKLAMTQSLQQSIQVLQFSIDELAEFVETQAMENPLIEVSEPNYALTYSKPRSSSGEELNYLSQIPDDRISLFEYLIDQVHLNYRDTFLRDITLFLIEYIDLNGFLTIDLDEVAIKKKATKIQVLDALTLIQQLDPAGVGARNLQECLMLQTERDDSAPNLAYLILEEHFEELVNRKWPELAKALAIPVSEVQTVFDYIQTLTPTPGASFGTTDGLYIIPDLTVKINAQGKIKIISNRRGMPEMHFQQSYFDQMAKKADAQTQKYLNEKKQDFESLQKMVQQRGDTILRVGQAIIANQQDFFFDDSRPIKPLILKDIAAELEIHESTVSRAVNGKYLETDFGIFELKHFFSQKVGIQNENGEEVSTDNVKVRLQTLVADEDKRKPLSDQKLVDLLKEEGLDISRRTVAKYRDALKIPSSSKRKRFD